MLVELDRVYPVWHASKQVAPLASDSGQFPSVPNDGAERAHEPGTHVCVDTSDPAQQEVALPERTYPASHESEHDWFESSLAEQEPIAALAGRETAHESGQQSWMPVCTPSEQVVVESPTIENPVGHAIEHDAPDASVVVQEPSVPCCGDVIAHDFGSHVWLVKAPARQEVFAPAT